MSRLALKAEINMCAALSEEKWNFWDATLF